MWRSTLSMITQTSIGEREGDHTASITMDQPTRMQHASS